MKKRAFRLLAGALAIMISLSAPLQTRADSVGGNVGGGGSGGMTGTTDYKAWSARIKNCFMKVTQQSVAFLYALQSSFNQFI